MERRWPSPQPTNLGRLLYSRKDSQLYKPRYPHPHRDCNSPSELFFVAFRDREIEGKKKKMVNTFSIDGIEQEFHLSFEDSMLGMGKLIPPVARSEDNPSAPQPQHKPQPSTETGHGEHASSLWGCQNRRESQVLYAARLSSQSSAKGGPTNRIRASASSQNSKVQNTPATSGETDTMTNTDSVDVKRERRKINRESGRRTREKKLNHSEEVKAKYSHLESENSSLLKKDNEVSEKLCILAKETWRMEKESLQRKERITNIRLRMNMITPTEDLWTKFDSLAVRENPSHFSQASNEEYSFPLITSTASQNVDVASGVLSKKKMVRTESMQRVASQEHLRKQSLLG